MERASLCQRIATCLLGLAALAAVAEPQAGQAQLIDQYYPSGIPGYRTWFTDAVLDRPRGEFDPLGQRAGSFLVQAALAEAFGVDSNINGSPRPQGSVVEQTRGSFGARSDWSRNALDASVGFDDARYLQRPELSHTDWTAGFGGAVDQGESRATAAFVHVTTTSLSAQIGTLSTGQPVVVSVDDVRASYEARLGRFTAVPSIEAGAYRFNSVLSNRLSETLNDHDGITGGLTVGYELAPGESLVAVARATDAQYTGHARGVPTPSYEDTSLAAGLDMRAGAVFRYRALLGVEQRSYANAPLTGPVAPLVEADVIWTPTRMTTVTAQASHSLQNAVSPGVVESYAYTNLRVVLDHEVRRNLLVQTFGNFQSAGFQVQGGTQHVLSVGASMTWLVNRRLSVVGLLSHARSRDATNTELNQADTRGLLTLEFHL